MFCSYFSFFIFLFSSYFIVLWWNYLKEIYLIFKIQMSHHEAPSSYIPETRFKCLTISIISVSLAVGLLIPNIELVLGLVGSTIGVLICVMFPAVAFICISTKSSQERLLAQVGIKIH